MRTISIYWITRFETVNILLQAVKWAHRRQHLDPSMRREAEEVLKMWKTPKHTSESVGLSSRLVFAVFLKSLEMCFNLCICRNCNLRMYCSCLFVIPCASHVFRVCRSEVRHEICAHGYSMCAVSQVLPVCQSAGLWALPSGHVCHLPRRQSRRAASQDKRYHQCLSQVWVRILWSSILFLTVHV